MQHTVNAFIRPGEQSGFVAGCPRPNAVTQGANLVKVVANLCEVVGLALDGEDLAELRFVAHPVIVVSMELEPAEV